MNILTTNKVAGKVERLSGCCLQLLSLCPELSPQDHEARNELVIIMSESRKMVELCQTLAREGIRNTEDIEHPTTSIFLRRFFSKIYPFEKRLFALIQRQRDKIGIIRSYGFNVGHDY